MKTKIGPLQAWQWALIVAAAGAVYLYRKHQQAAAAAAAQAPPTIVGDTGALNWPGFSPVAGGYVGSVSVPAPSSGQVYGPATPPVPYGGGNHWTTSPVSVTSPPVTQGSAYGAPGGTWKAI